MKNIQKLLSLLIGVFNTALIIGILAFVIYYFYAGETKWLFDNFILNIIFLAVMVDGLFLLVHLPRRKIKHKDQSFDPTKLTIIIACYNGQEVIGETIKQALVHVPPNQVIVVSDASTDKTVETASSYGVRVVENKRNLNKAFSISFVMKHVHTPYVLILDDDTLIGNTFIPTSLLDEGYDAVAFNVEPLNTGTLVNKLQMFEYRKSMIMGKSLRASAGAVGNISGAMGLYRTRDLVHQVTRHSGQFGGEDQQRTSFVHLYGLGKGITYTDSTVVTKVPDTPRQLFRQRSFRWNLSLPELFFVYSTILIKPKFHYLLKIEKAYQMYLLATDPVRMLFFWLVFLRPLQALVLYGFYTFFTFLTWLKVGRKDPLWIIPIFPIYSMLESLCRFIAHFYWFRIKYLYLFEKKLHRLVPERRLVFEYAGVLSILIVLWAMSVLRFQSALDARFSYIDYAIYTGEFDDHVEAVPQRVEAITEIASYKIESPIIMVTIREGDGKTAIARRALKTYLRSKDLNLNASQLVIAEDYLQESISLSGPLHVNEEVGITLVMVQESIDYAIKTWPF